MITHSVLSVNPGEAQVLSPVLVKDNLYTTIGKMEGYDSYFAYRLLLRLSHPNAVKDIEALLRAALKEQ